ncbi:MAG: CbiX/SirB N-terminal domain-containing protein [Venatoribacter sp.]
MTTHLTLLLAHGSRDPHWLAPFTSLLKQINSALPAVQCTLAYLELAEPSLEQSIRAAIAQGVYNIDIIPLFFASGRHLRHDVPVLLEKLQQEAKLQGIELNIHLSQPVGLEPEVAEAISKVIQRQLS